MDDPLNDKKKIINILNRIQKKDSTYECILIMKKQNFTNNAFYYFLCVLFRFIHLLIFSGDYQKNIQSRNILRKLTCLNFIRVFNVSFIVYASIIIIIIILLIIRLIMYYYIIKEFLRNEFSNKWILPNKYLIIIEHIIFLLFPYIIEFLSLSYYIFFFRDNFIPQMNINNNLLIIIIVLCTFLIVIYNVDNYIGIICSNKVYSTTIFDIYTNKKSNKILNNKPVIYHCSFYTIYILIALQNFVIFITLGEFLNKKENDIFTIIISITFLLLILIFFYIRINEYIYENFINNTLHILIIYCFYSITIDYVLYLLDYRITLLFSDIFYVLIKLTISYITFYLAMIRRNSFLESKILEMFFQENAYKKNKNFINCLYILHYKIIAIKEQKRINTAFLLAKSLSNHIEKCSKTVCDCKLFDTFINKEKIIKLNDNEINKYIPELLIILNYLFECSFVNYDYYNNYNMCILLAEHYCHCKDNPIMGFSIINTYLLRQRNKFSKFEIVNLYELSQKYIYYINCANIINIESDIQNDKKELLIRKQKNEEFEKYFNNLKIIYKTKRYMCDYIYNEMKILKYKFLFEDSLSFKYDEYNEKIISVKINFFEKTLKIDDSLEKNKKHQKQSTNKKSNLNKVVDLVKNEQLFYQKIINTIHLLEMNKGLPIDMLFKYILFFDIFEGGKMPTIFKDKLFQLLDRDSSFYNNFITKIEYDLITKKYNETSNKKDSKSFIVIELKKELSTKYFSENGALKLGFKQKDIINASIEQLMPVEFSKSHQILVKHLIVNQQYNFNNRKKSFFFDKTRTVLYSVNVEICFIYNLSKSLFFIMMSEFILEKDLTFMLDHNFELLANTKNFEDEYYLNQNIFQKYNFNFLNILKLRPEKIHKIYKHELDNIHFQKLIRQIRTEEYFISQLFVSNNGKNISILNPHYFNTMKNNYLSKVLNNQKKSTDTHMEVDEEKQELLIKKDININNSISELLTKSWKIYFNKTYNTVVNKGVFIENIEKELSKIPENDAMLEKDKLNYKLIMHSKQLINKLLKNKELTKEFIKIKINFSFYYDKYYYFISLEDDKKYFNDSKSVRFKNLQNIEKKTTNTFNYKNKIPYKKKSSNSISRNKNRITEKKNKKNLLENKIDCNNKIKNHNDYDDAIFDKIVEQRKIINRDFFIIIIKWILTIIIGLILIIYIIIIFYQRYILNVSKQMLFAYFHNANIRQILLYAHSRTIQIFYDYYNLTDNKILTEQEYQNILKGEADTIKDNYASFQHLYLDFSSKLNNKFSILYDKKQYKKIKGFWKEETYISDYSSEIGFIVYLMYSLDVTNKREEKLNIDMDNFVFFRGKNEEKKAHTHFIQLLYYMCANYEFRYKDLFLNIDKEIFNSYNIFMNNNNVIYISLELLGLFLYLANVLTVSYYLYSSNSIIIKNVIFLFLDFSEDNKEENNNFNKVIIQKLKEFKYLIDDFSNDKLENFSLNIDKLNMNKCLSRNNSHNDSEIIATKKTNKNLDKSSNNKNNNNNKKKSIKLENDDYQKNININLMLEKSKNNSSHNYLVESISQFDKLNNRSLNSSKDILTDNNKNKKENLNISNKNIKKEGFENQKNYRDLILNKSNSGVVLLIKIYLIFMLLLFLAIVAFIIYKIKFSLNCNIKFRNFFQDFSTITNRYAILYYYFNAIRTLLIYPNDERKIAYEKVMEGLEDYYEAENKKFLRVLTDDMHTYTNILDLFNLLMQSKAGLESEYKQKVCGTIAGCNNYIDSEINIFTTGVDFGFKACLKEVTDIYLDYQKIKNKMDLEELNKTIINSENSQFVAIGVGLGSCIMYVINKILELFKIDVTNFNDSYIYNTTLLNIISIALSILTFLFVLIFIIFSISNFIKPIKEATYRINCSFYYIKKFSLTYKCKIDKKFIS